jgi:hypothetical protein
MKSMHKIITIEKKAIELICKRCGHLWPYTGNKQYACSCPKCNTNVVIYPRKIIEK